MDYRDRHVVVTGGTGALGAAVLDGLLGAGAICHVPYRSEEAARRSPHRGSAEEVAATVLFLASPENSVTQGAVVPVYGKS